MIDKIKEIGNQINGIIEPLFNQVLAFLEKEYFIIYGILFLFVGILTIIGLFAFLKKAPKLFIFLVVLLGIIVALDQFIIRAG